MKKLVCVSLLCILLGFTAFAQETAYPDISEEYTNTLETSGTETEKVQKEMKSKLSTLWTVVTLNMILADVLTSYIPETVDEFTEFADGKESEIMFAGAIYYQIPISMILLSKVLPYKANRLANIIAAGMITVTVVAGGSTDPHYIVCAGAEVLCLSLITWYAWKWSNPEGKHKDNKHDLGLNLNYEKKAYSLTYTYKF
jgi:hypothetical protein